MPPTSLAQRNLLRHVTWGLPAGQDIAAAIGAPAVAAADLGELAGYSLGLETKPHGVGTRRFSSSVQFWTTVSCRRVDDVSRRTLTGANALHFYTCVRYM